VDLFPLPADANYSYARAFAPGGHQGTDIFAPRGTPVVAVERGWARSATDPKGGQVVYLESLELEGDPPGPSRVYYYAHLDDILSDIKPTGTMVQAGHVLGHVGTSGNAQGTDPHLHFQERIDGETRDPYDDLRAVDRKTSGGKPALPAAYLAPIGVAVLVGLVLWAMSGKKRR
jgi:murein DD-endopeptidase MepM/ murein hydrolase activator NlpD